MAHPSRRVLNINAEMERVSVELIALSDRNGELARKTIGAPDDEYRRLREEQATLEPLIDRAHERYQELVAELQKVLAEELKADKGGSA